MAFDKQSPHWGRPYIARNSEEETAYLADLAVSFITHQHLHPDDMGAHISHDADAAWAKHSKRPRIDSNPNSWWTDECQLAKDKYISNRTRENLKAFNAATRTARQDFFAQKIDTMTENNAPWEGIRWTRPRPPPKYSTILHDGAPIPDVPSLFDVMHGHFSSCHATNSVSNAFLNTVPQHEERSFPRISRLFLFLFLFINRNDVLDST